MISVSEPVTNLADLLADSSCPRTGCSASGGILARFLGDVDTTILRRHPGVLVHRPLDRDPPPPLYRAITRPR